MSFGELCYKYPKVAIQKISDDYKIYCEKAPKVGKCLQLRDRFESLQPQEAYAKRRAMLLLK